jgi:hypothetical protein
MNTRRYSIQKHPDMWKGSASRPSGACNVFSLCFEWLPAASAPASFHNAFTKGEENSAMPFSILPIVSILAGLLILIIPRMLNYIVAIYLILAGIIGLLHL